MRNSSLFSETLILSVYFSITFWINLVWKFLSILVASWINLQARGFLWFLIDSHFSITLLLPPIKGNDICGNELFLINSLSISYLYLLVSGCTVLRCDMIFLYVFLMKVNCDPEDVFLILGVARLLFWNQLFVY